MNIEEYIDQLIDNDLEKNHWFMTKQTMSDYYFAYYIAYIVDTFKDNHEEGQRFADYYQSCFRDNPETKELYPTQAESENTFRNAIISEYLGLIKREDSQYAHASSTDAYKRLSEYIKKYSDVDKYRDIVDRQIEKICLNVIERADKYESVKSVTIFPVVFLYKVLLGLYDEYRDSTLTFEEFALFVIRSQSYVEYTNVLDLIKQFRNHEYDDLYDAKIQTIMNHQSTKNIRFDTLFGTLKHIDYKSDDYYRIKDDQESYNYVRNVVNIYESSSLFGNVDKDALIEFMRSDLYFKGSIDNVPQKETVSEKEFKQLIKKEDEFLKRLKKLAKEYGEEGTTSVTTEVRLASVQQAFRDKLIEKHGQKCLLCSITNKEMLIASHIKDARKSNIYEKADFDNGLLLCANHDKLFDRFLITFNFYDGKIQISKCLTDEEKQICALDENYHLPDDLLTEKRQEYLAWHNEEFQKREMER